MINDGINDKEYIFFEGDEDINHRLSSLINELCHVFRLHADGNWKEIYKPKYTEKMATEIAKKPSLIKKLLALKDPVVSNITYSVVEFNKRENIENNT